METIAPVSTAPRLDVVDGVATITLNRPLHRNRLENGDLHQLLQHVDRLNADKTVRVVVFTANTEGQGKPVFSAGYHIGGFEEEGSDPDFFEKIPDAIAQMRPITVCALNGSVYGGATDILMACDIGVALEGAELRMPAAALGLHYYPSGLRRYMARLGQSMTMQAFLTAQAMPIETLDKTGLLTALFPARSWDAGVNDLVSKIRDLAPIAAQLTKKTIREISAGSCDDEVVRKRQELTSSSLDFIEGRKAFSEKRKPRFSGQ
jgi:enoyl-CoA hydratase/carnithine racemase